MKKIIVLLVAFSSMQIFAMPDLASGDYGVSVKDRKGKVHHCTISIQNVKEVTGSEYLIMNIQDCPPKLTDLTLIKDESSGLYSSDKIFVTTRRAGFKMYDIQPLSESSFVMTSYREYGDGGVAKPRKVKATLK